MRRARHTRASCQTLPRLLRPLALLITLATSLWAVCRQPHPRVCTEFFDSDVVLSGTVIAVRTDGAEDFPAGWFYTVRVGELFRGPSGKTVEFWTENSSARFPLSKGRQYLLFAQKDDSQLELTCCGNSTFLEDSADAIRQIREILKTKSGGEISGRIGRVDSNDFAGVRVTAIGAKGTFEVLTDKNSWFHMRVPDGAYRVRAHAPGRNFVSYDLSYDDPDNIVVHPGGCPQVQLIPAEWDNGPRPAPKPD